MGHSNDAQWLEHCTGNLQALDSNPTHDLFPSADGPQPAICAKPKHLDLLPLMFRLE